MKTYDIALFFILCIFSMCNYSSSSSVLKEYYFEDVCGNWNTEKIDIRYIGAGVLKSAFGHTTNCNLTLSPKQGYSVVLSISRYSLHLDDILSITDSDNIVVNLRGGRHFYDEEKSFTSNGPMTIQFVTNDTYSYYGTIKFQFIFTQVHDGQCRHEEFQCRNLNCIPYSLTCNNHNHCGDNSDQTADICNAGPTEEYFPGTPITTIETRTNSVIFYIIIGAILLISIIIIIPLIVFAVKKSKRTATPQAVIPSTLSQAPTALATQIPTASISQLPTVHVLQNPTAPSQMHTAPSAFTRLRQSFRRSKSSSQPPTSADTKEMDNYQVPSMYPQIPDATNPEGVENPEFKIEE